MAKRQCQGQTKKGASCKAAPLKDSDYCLAHADGETRALIGFGGAENGALGGRPRRPREIELIQEVAEEFRDDLRAVYSEGLTAERGVVVGDGENARVEYVADHSHRLRTAQEIQDRLHGKPRSTNDVAAHVDVNLNLVTDGDLREQAAALRRGLAANRPVKPSGLDAGD